jgi:hypothetical protein
MTVQKLDHLLMRRPFVPLKITLDDGEHFYIATQLRALAMDDKLFVGWSKDPFAPPEERRLRIIPVSRVVEAKDVDASRLRRPRGK